MFLYIGQGASTVVVVADGDTYKKRRRPTMGRLREDTSPEAEAKLVEITRRMTPDQKWRQTFALIRTVRAFAMAGVRSRYPDASPEELHKRFAARVLDAETVRRVYGWDPEKEGY